MLMSVPIETKWKKMEMKNLLFAYQPFYRKRWRLPYQITSRLGTINLENYLKPRTHLRFCAFSCP
jgi:hypothetical protein